MANPREVQLRIGSIKNIAQVTGALQAVSASKVKKAMSALMRTRPYATKAWQVLMHMAAQPGRSSLHPLLAEREKIERVLVIMISGDRGLAGAYISNIVRFTQKKFDQFDVPVKYITVGRKGRDLMLRRGKDIIAEFSNLPAAPSFLDVSAIGRMAVDEYLDGNVDAVYLVYTDFVNMGRQIPTAKKLLPFEYEAADELRVQKYENVSKGPNPTYIYEPSPEELLDEIIPRFTGLQVYQAVMESLASEHASRMIAMKNATDNATDLSAALQLEYNKARQKSITSEMLDIAGGAEALAQS
ncbi:MAG: ATP synthase F1 subunit gamma [Anaerolineae bacterium]|nr:ATP synthase F1 subunit gamma [Anaerolineae bacterium]